MRARRADFKTGLPAAAVGFFALQSHTCFLKVSAASCPCLPLFSIPVRVRDFSFVGMMSCLARLHARLQDRAVRDFRCLIFVAFDSFINFLDAGALSCQFPPRFPCPARFLAVWFVSMTSCLACVQDQLQDRVARGYGCLLAKFIDSHLNFLKVKAFVARPSY